MNVHTNEPMGRASCKKPRPSRSDVQNAIGINRQQRRRAAEQHGKHVQRDDSQNDFVMENEIESRQQGFEGHFFPIRHDMMRVDLRHHEAEHELAAHVDRVNGKRAMPGQQNDSRRRPAGPMMEAS